MHKGVELPRHVERILASRQRLTVFGLLFLQALSVGPEFVVLDSGDKSLVVPLEGITRMQLLERERSIRWNVKLDPGEEKSLTYQYERYVKSN